MRVPAAELLAEDRVVGARRGKVIADHPLDPRVGVGDLGAIGLQLHVEVLGAVAVDRDEVGFGRQREGDREVVGEGEVTRESI